MFAYASKSPTYDSSEYGNLYVPRVSGVEGTMAWLDSLARRHYLTQDSSDSFVNPTGFNWKKFYDEESSDSCSPNVAPPYDIEGYPMYVSGFWNQFKIAAKLLGRQIGTDLDNAPYPNISNNFRWSGVAMNPGDGVGTLPDLRNVNENMFDVGQIPKLYYETFIGNVSPVSRSPERVGFRQVLGRANHGITFFPEREVLELAVTQTQRLSIFRNGNFVAREVVDGPVLGQYHGIDFNAAPPFDMESINSLWGKDVGDIEWTIFYQSVRYSAIYDPHENTDLLEGKWDWDGSGTIPTSDFAGSGPPKYSGPQNVDSSGYYIDRYTETYCATSHFVVPHSFGGTGAADGFGFNKAYGDVVIDDKLPTYPETNPMYPIAGYFSDSAPSGYFNATGDKNYDMSHYLKYSTFGAVPMSSTYDITRRLGLTSDVNYDLKFRHHERIGRTTNTQQETFGNLVTDYWYTPKAYNDSNMYRKVVAASPMFSGFRGTSLFELSPGINGQFYNVVGQSPAAYGSGRFFEDISLDDGFSPIIDEHNSDGYFLSVASFIDQSGLYPDRKTLIYNSRGGDGRIFYTKKSSPDATSWPPAQHNAFFRTPLTPVSGIMKISGVIVAQGALDQYDQVSTQLNGPGGGAYGGFFNVEGGGPEGYTGLAGVGRSGCYQTPWDGMEGLTSDTHNVNYGAEFTPVDKNLFEYYSFAAEVENLKAGGGRAGELLTPEFGFPYVSGTIQEAGPAFKGRVGIAFFNSTVSNMSISVAGNGLEGPFDTTLFGTPSKIWLFPMWTRYNQYVNTLYQVQSISNLGDFPSKAHQIQDPYGYVNFVRPSSYLKCGNAYVDINAADNLFPEDGEYPISIGDGDVETIPAFYG